MLQVSPEDEHLLLAFEWYLSAKGYYVRQPTVDGKQVCIYLHRTVANAPTGVLVDHANGDLSDNRRSNLRLCTHAENMRNRKVSKANKLGLKGVYFDLHRGKYVAQIKFEGRRYRLGRFDTVDAAKFAYDEAARRLHGKFART